MENTKANFKPAPGFILILPLEKDKKSDYAAVIDNTDQPHKGHVLAIGPNKTTDYGIMIEPTVEAGDFVLFSIAGCERFRMEYKDNPRQEFVIAPFSRVLGEFK